MGKRKVTSIVSVKDGQQHNLVIGHALVGDDGSIQVYLDVVPKGATNFKIHSEDEPVAEGTPHVFFTGVNQVIRKMHLGINAISNGDARDGIAAMNDSLLILETLPGYQDWMDDLNADDIERKT
jgi:hypothetical protein